ncbi:arylsulfatase [Aquiflexum sp.]|uniref:sulfatase family protein n=1 Tax=Aquiflexum sp. TaxID=1872584 RepID=UPI00359485AD
MVKIKVFLLSFTISCLIVLTGYAQNSSQLPNIIYILADDMGYGDVSSFNPESKIITPHIDRLANNGIKFTDAYTSSAVCTPTRYGILTGRYNWRSELKSGVLGGYSPPLIESDRLTVGEMLQEKGYHTGFVGKWHLGWDWYFETEMESLNNLGKNFEIDFTKVIKNGPGERGFSYSYGFSGSLDMPPYVYVENGWVTALPNRVTVNMDEKAFWRKGQTGSDFEHVQVLPHLTEKAVQYIAQRSRNSQPFFLYLALPAPHTPILPLTEFMGKSNTNLYGDFMLQVDDVVGRITGALDEHGLLENTLLIFTSDNGCSPRASFPELMKVGHHPSYIFRGHKADIFEGGLRVPFIVHWPEKVSSPKSTEVVISTTDLMATLAELTSYPLPPNAAEDSFSFLDILENKPTVIERPQVVLHSIEGRFAIRKEYWKLILWPGSGGWSDPKTSEGLEYLPSMQLYDLQRDPGETQNLIDQYPQVVRQLREELIRLIQDGRSTPGPKQRNDGPEIWDQVKWILD